MVLELSEELQLVELAKTNSDAMGKIYDLYFQKVFNFVYAKLGDRNAAEDLVSEIFMKIVENIDRFEYRGIPFGAWIFKITRNMLFDYYVKTGKQKNVSLEEGIEIKDEKEDFSPNAHAKKSELSQRVKSVLAELPEREVSIVQLKFFSGLNNREIAATLNLSESNVGIILFRVLKKIKPDLSNLI